EDIIYKLLNLAEAFVKDKQLIICRINMFKLRDINKDSREHINESLQYDHKDVLKLCEELGVSNFNKDKSNETRHDTQSDTNEKCDDKQKISDDNNKDKVIEVLERELEHSKDKLRKSEKEKETLMRLLDQQQRLSLQANQKIEILESMDQEIKEEIKDGEKKKW